MDHQRDAYGGRYVGVDFFDIRYDLIARAMGCHGERVEKAEEIRPALQRAIDSRLPAILDVIIDREANLDPPDFQILAGIWLEGCEMPEGKQPKPEKIIEPGIAERAPIRTKTSVSSEEI